MTPEETEQSEQLPPAVDTASRPRRVLLFAVVAALVLSADIVSKVIVVAQLPLATPGHPGHKPVRILGGVLYLDQTRNSGAAFSLGAGFTAILTVLAVVVAAVIVRTAKRLRSRGWAVAFGLVLGGALGNLVDRLFRDPGIGRGHVVDWLSLFGPNGQYWPIFNVADAGIVCGALVAVLLGLFGVDLTGRGTRG